MKLPTDSTVNPDQNTDYAVCLAKQGLQNKKREMTEINTESEAVKEGTGILDRKDEISEDPGNIELHSPVKQNIEENRQEEATGSPSPTLPRR